MQKLLTTSLMVGIISLSGCTTVKEIFGHDKTGTHDIHSTMGKTAPVTSLDGILVDNDRKMTLYTYDKDTVNTSNCNALCLAAWPAFLAPGPTQSNDGRFTTIQRDNGKYQWAFKGKPLYFYANDTKMGDKNGEGKMDVWHTVSTR